MEGRRRRKKRKRIMGKKFNDRMQQKLFWVMGIGMLCFALLIYKLFYWHNNYGDAYGKKVLSQQSYVSSALEYKRGDILDRNNTKLATSKLLYNVVIDPKTILAEEGKMAIISAITKYFEITEDELMTQINKRPNSQYYVMLKNVSKDTVDAYNEFYKEEKNRCKKADEKFLLNENAVYFEKVYKRTYPLEDTACSVIGFSSAHNEGLWGLERQYNEELNGITGRAYGYYTADSDLVKTVKSAQDGNSIVTTLDVNIQQIVQKRIDKFMKKTGAKNVASLVMNPKNGEIYAMSSNIRYDLNNAFDLSHLYSASEIAAFSDEEKSEKLNQMWSNFCISYSYEPGSTYKPMTVAAALEESIVTNNSSFVCNGGEDVAGTWIKCVSNYGHGNLSLQGSLMESCNDVMMQIVARMGKETFARYENVFNIGTKTGIDLPGETTGLAYGVDTLGPTELATSSFGQSMTVNMVQIASAFSSIINGGNYYQPHVVKQILDENGNVVKNIEPTLLRKTVSDQTSKYLRNYLKATVEDGTGATAGIKGYSIGGKTGTAEKIPRRRGNYLVSFIGAAPMENPEVVVYVIVDEPHVKEQYHSTYAQEVARGIFKDILPFLGVYRDEAAVRAEQEKAQEGVAEPTQEPKDEYVNAPEDEGGANMGTAVPATTNEAAATGAPTENRGLEAQATETP